MAEPSSLRCAVYTRKSSEEGLEQQFNSLDAQREACIAYIASQRHEGWRLVDEHYDDGGFSGGNIDRPGLNQLLVDIAAGKIDVIVVYKIDRLTRSLADFAKIVDVLDQAKASFVSVTQSFNTTTSMGRLTLNVLLSFAQFEREVTGERIRDKIAASKKKGMWMGGTAPLGYEPAGRSLTIVKDDARLVRHIFERFLQLPSVDAVVEELHDQGVRSKVRTSRHGRQSGGCRLYRGPTYLMLQNPVYRGMIKHKTEVYPGNHEPIIDEALWNKVQEKIAANRVVRATGHNAKWPSLLVGRIFGDDGVRGSPAHAHKGSRRYHYYCFKSFDGQKPLRLPAADIDRIVLTKLAEFLANKDEPDPDAARRVFRALREDRATIAPSLISDCRDALNRYVAEVRVLDCRLRIVFSAGEFEPDGHFVTEVETKRLRSMREARYVLAIPGTGQAVVDQSLLKLMAKAHAARKAMLVVDAILPAVAAAHGHTVTYFKQLLRIGHLAPDIQSAIVEGREPIELTRKTLALASDIPDDWNAQRRLFGF